MNMLCPSCNGKKTALAHVNTGEDSTKHYWADVPCFTCEGTGAITEEHMTKIDDGKKMRKERLALGESLMQAAKRLEMTPAQLSAIEHGRRTSSCA